MKVIVTEDQIERFAERMAYIDKIIKTQMREGANWEHLAWLIERYGLTQEDVDIIGMIQRMTQVGKKIRVVPDKEAADRLYTTWKKELAS